MYLQYLIFASARTYKHCAHKQVHLIFAWPDEVRWEGGPCKHSDKHLHSLCIMLVGKNAVMVLSVFSPDNFTTCFIEETLKQYDHPTTQRSIESVAGGNFSLMSATVLSGHLHGGQEAVCTFAPPPVMALTLLISGSFPSAVSRFYSTRIFCNLSHSGWCLLHFINVEKILFLPSSQSCYLLNYVHQIYVFTWQQLDRSVCLSLLFLLKQLLLIWIPNFDISIVIISLIMTENQWEVCISNFIQCTKSHHK